MRSSTLLHIGLPLRRTLVLLVILLGTLQASARIRTDIFIPGTKEKPTWYYAPDGEDFMKKWGLSPGDTIAIRTGPAGENYMNNIDLGHAIVKGITFINASTNTKQIEIGWVGMGSQCVDIKFLGNGSPSIKYGFKLFDQKQLGLSFGCVGDIEMSYVEVDGAAMGLQLTTKTGYAYPVNYQRANIHHLLIKNVSDEAMYIGWVNDSPILMEIWVHDNIIRNSGRDGIQTRNTRKVLIENNDLDSVGMRGDWGHDHGILLGNCVEGGIVQRNTLKNIDGIGIWNDGFGNFTYSCNEIHAKGEALYSRPYNPDRPDDWGDSEGIGYQKVTATDNTLTSDKGIAGAWLYNDSANKVVELTAYNNLTSGVWKINPSVKFTQTNNNLFAVPACGKIVPLPLPEDDPKPPTKPKPNKGKYRIYNLAAAYLGTDKKNLQRGWYILKYEDGTTEFLRVEK